MLEIEELLNNLITENNYDKRIIPYIKEFFRYNAKEYNWTKEEIKDKIELIAQKVNGVEFVHLGDKYALTDHSFKNMLINRDIKEKDLSYKEIISLSSEIFFNLEIATKEEKEDEGRRYYWKDNSEYPLTGLKYSRNNYDKENILNIMSNAFNIDYKDIYDIEEIFRNELENSSNDNKTRKRFLDDSLTIFIPSLKECISKVINPSNLNEKSQQYLSIYATSLLAMKYRLENESEDKSLIKMQYQALTDKLSEIAEDYVITADRLKEHRIDNTFVINLEQIDSEIREELKGIEIAKEKEEIKVDDLGKSLSAEFMQEASCINSDEKLKDTYIQKQIAKVLPKYDGRFRIIIQEYLSRSAKIYNWTKDEFDKKVRNYIKNIEKIEFAKKLEGHRISNLGYWSRNNKKFAVKDDMIFRTNNEVLGVFFHEQEHATDMTIRNNGKDLESELQYGNINEYATEIGAIHLVSDKIYDDELCFTHSMNGYDEFKYAGSMISAALGISEFEFAKLRDEGNVEFNKFFKEKYPYLNTETVLEEFDDILYRIDNAPSIMNMRQMSEAYAGMYNIANTIIKARIEHEKGLAPNQGELENKSKYEMAKIANNMKLAKRKLNLKNRFIKPIIEDDTILKKHSKVTPEDRKKYMYLVERIYPEKNLKFDNGELSKHINRNFRYPIIGKIYKALGKNKLPMLNAPTSFEQEKEVFNKRIVVNGIKTNAQELGIDNNEINRNIEKIEKGNEAK